MRPFLIVIATVALFTGPSQTQALDQAFCSLRDPNTEIYSLFPEADSYRSIVRLIGQKTRDALSKSLPFTLHFNELAEHTVYIAQEGKEPLGLVHLRSEASKWGLVEIAWALDFDLHILDFSFVRCRDRSKKTFEENREIRAKIIGANLTDLKKFLRADGNSLNLDTMPIDPKDTDLGVVIIRNALKTIAVTQNAWNDALVDLRDK